MSRNGSGVFTPYTPGNPVVTGTTISSTAFNNTITDIGNEITNSVPRDGQAAPTNNLPMGNFRHTGVGNAQARTDYASAGQVQDGTFNVLSSVSGTDTITGVSTPSITAYVAGQKFLVVVSGTNTTTSPTLNINSVGANAIVLPGGASIVAGTIPTNGAYFVYNGTNFVLINPTNLPAQSTYDARYAQLAAAQSFTKAQRGAITALTDAATITPDFSAANNFSVTLGGNRTLANPTNITAGQSGVLVVTQDATGGRTLAFGSYWKFASGTAPTLTTTASAVDLIVYYVDSSTRIDARFIGDVK